MALGSLNPSLMTRSGVSSMDNSSTLQGCRLQCDEFYDGYSSGNSHRSIKISSRGSSGSSRAMRIKMKGAAAASALLSTSLFKPAAALTSLSDTDLSNSYHLSRILFLRLLAVVYIAAFSVARNQNKGLIGDRGITPAKRVLDNAQHRAQIKSQQRKEWIKQRDQYRRSKYAVPRFLQSCKNKLADSHLATLFRDKFWYRTDGMDRPLLTLLWLADNRSKLNPWLDNLANIGLFLSTIMLTTGSANAVLILGLWIIQRSLMAVGGVWYGYGWEPQLAELTFHAMFLVPFISMNPFFGMNGLNGPFDVPKIVIWAVRFYLFKIMMGAGLIKIKSSDRKWKDMTAMYYFYETQPVPNPLTRYFHFMPNIWHRFEVWSNHFVELVAPFMLLLPFRQWRLIGGLIQILFQIVLISSGNLSFLNWLTIVPAILCLDDQLLSNNLPHLLRAVAIGTTQTQTYLNSITTELSAAASPITRTVISTIFILLMIKLNIPVIRNLMARKQLMNGSFDKLRLASTYGAFGTVAEKRIELIIESACDINGPWREYRFKVKPGDVHRCPSWISPYHCRLDWQMWIASQLGRVERSPWMYNFLIKLLNQEKCVIDLLEEDPWSAESMQPKYIRIEKYKYNFYNGHQNPGNSSQIKPQYWTRERVGRFFPRQGVITADMLSDIIEGGG